jgi:site-specific recombinase XerD
MIRRHADPYLVKELLGHKDFSSMDFYARLTIVDLKAAHRRFHPRERDSRRESGGESEKER